MKSEREVLKLTGYTLGILVEEVFINSHPRCVLVEF